MTVPTYCMQCALEHKPETAIGVDVDGEPACAVHQFPNEYRSPGVFLPPIKLEPIERKAQPEASAAQKEKPAMPKVCKCGCGEAVSASRGYAYGHKPKGAKASKPARATETPGAEESAEESATLVVSLTNVQANSFFLSLTLSDKVRLLAKFLES